MREEIDRILRMAEDGTLTRDQAAEMIEALKDTTDAGGNTRARTASEDGRGEKRRSHGRRRRSRHRRGSSGTYDYWAGALGHGSPGLYGLGRFDKRGDFDLGILGDEIQQAVEIGEKALRGAFSGSRISELWVNDSNTAILVKADEPQGEDFRCEDNRLNVAQLRDIRLCRAEFCDNDVSAARLADLEVTDGKFNANALRGSSLRHALIEHSDVIDNQLSGAQISRLTLGRSTVRGNRFSGAHIREMGMAESVLESSEFSGVKLKNIVGKAGTHIKHARFNGVMGRDWLLDAAVMSDVVMNGMVVSGLVLDHAGLERCEIKTRDGARRGDQRDWSRIRDLTLKRVVMKDCEFVDCRFDRTTIENCTVEGLRFDGVDFSGLTLSSAEALVALAQERDVA